MIKFFAILYLVAFSIIPGALNGQTVLPEGQTKPQDAPAHIAPLIRILMPDGSMRYVSLGTGIVLNTGTTPWRIDVPALAAAPISLVTLRLNPITTPQFNHGWNWTQTGITGTGLFLLTRNGLAMLPTLDYIVQGNNTVVFTAAVDPKTGQKSDPTDIVMGIFAALGTPSASLEREAVRQAANSATPPKPGER